MDDEPKSCFKGKGVLVKCLAVLLTALVVILIALFINLVIRKDDHACNSEFCIKSSAEIIRHIDQSENPCEDFYAFTCGNFLKNFKDVEPPPATEQLNFMIMEPRQLDDPRPLAMEKRFYQSCVNLGAIEMDQEMTILDTFHLLGDWPVLQGASWDVSNYDLVDFMVRSKNLGLKFEWFLEFSIFEDVNDTQRNFLKIGIPSYLKRIEEDVQHLRRLLVTDIVVFMGASKSVATYEAFKMVQFEDELGAIAEKHRHGGDWRESPSKLAISVVQQMWPSIIWLELINNITGSAFSESDLVIFDVTDYLKDLHRVFFDYSKRIHADFVMWKMMEDFWPFLSKPIRDKFEEYRLKAYNETPQLDRQRFCLDQAKKQFPFVAESVFIRKHVTDEKKLMARQIVDRVHLHLIRLLETASWMNREIRRQALDRIRQVSLVVGGPEEVFNEFGFYNILGVSEFEYRSFNVIDMLREKRSRDYAEYYSLVNRGVADNRIAIYGQMVNISSFSVVNSNTIVIPAALLQDTFYNPKLPNYLNYATLGKSIARKLFEHLYNENDTYSWWALDAFDDVIKCLLKESASLPGSEYKRSRRLKEDLADFVVADIAYESYKHWLLNHHEELMLPGLALTPYQLFWIQTSKASCTRILPRGHRDDPRFKVIGPLRNSRNFASDFNCPEGSRMNSRRKCRVL